jgi:hypothetical protein
LFFNRVYQTNQICNPKQKGLKMKAENLRIRTDIFDVRPADLGEACEPPMTAIKSKIVMNCLSAFINMNMWFDQKM